MSQRYTWLRYAVAAGLLAIIACVSPALRQAEIAQPAPCGDSVYVQLKRQNPDSLSERSWQRFQALDRECSVARVVSQRLGDDGMHAGNRGWTWMGLGAGMMVMMAAMVWAWH